MPPTTDPRSADAPAAPDRLTIEQAADASRELGVAALPLYVIHTTPVDGLGPIRANLEAHLAYQFALEAEGTLFGAGPLGTEDGLHYDGDGLVIVRAGSFEEARAIADRDPMHTSGARSYRIRPWVLNEGSITVTAHLSDLTVRIG